MARKSNLFSSWLFWAHWLADVKGGCNWQWQHKFHWWPTHCTYMQPVKNYESAYREEVKQGDDCWLWKPQWSLNSPLNINISSVEIQEDHISWSSCGRDSLRVPITKNTQKHLCYLQSLRKHISHLHHFLQRDNKEHSEQLYQSLVWKLPRIWTQGPKSEKIIRVSLLSTMEMYTTRCIHKDTSIQQSILHNSLFSALCYMFVHIAHVYFMSYGLCLHCVV